MNVASCAVKLKKKSNFSDLIFDPTASEQSVLLCSSHSQSLLSLSAWLALSFPWPLLATCQRREPLQPTLTNKLCLSEHLGSEWRFHSVRTLSRIEGKPAQCWSSAETLPSTAVLSAYWGWRCWLSKYDKILDQITCLIKSANIEELTVATFRLMFTFKNILRLFFNFFYLRLEYFHFLTDHNIRNRCCLTVNSRGKNKL